MPYKPLFPVGREEEEKENHNKEIFSLFRRDKFVGVQACLYVRISSEATCVAA